MLLLSQTCQRTAHRSYFFFFFQGKDTAWIGLLAFHEAGLNSGLQILPEGAGRAFKLLLTLTSAGPVCGWMGLFVHPYQLKPNQSHTPVPFSNCLTVPTTTVRKLY